MNKTINIINALLYAISIKLTTLGRRFFLLSERRQASARGWQKLPTFLEIIKYPSRAEVVLMSQRFLSPGRRYTLVDIGANYGDWASRFLACIDCAYIGFEPDPRAFRRLKTRKIHGAKLINKCCGAETATVQFRISEDATYSSKYSYNELGITLDSARIENVAQVKVDDEIRDADNVILKVDVQGAESEVLKGAINTLKRTEIVIVEVPLLPQTDNGSGFLEISSVLRESGFVPLYFCLAGASYRSNQIPIEYDVIFVNSKSADIAARIQPFM